MHGLFRQPDLIGRARVDLGLLKAVPTEDCHQWCDDAPLFAAIVTPGALER
jgi:hypothetical protein